MCFESGVWGGSLPRPDLSDGRAVRGSMCLALDKHAARGPPPPATPGPCLLRVSLASTFCPRPETETERPAERQRDHARETQRDRERCREGGRGGRRDRVLSSAPSWLCPAGPGPVENGNVGGASCSEMKNFQVARPDRTGGTLWSLSASRD